MGRNREILQARKMLAAITGGAACAFAAAAAQTDTAPSVVREAVDLSNLRVVLPKDEIQPGVIDFENAEGPQVGAGIVLTNQYEKSNGVTFGKGDSVEFCRRVTDDVMASLCPYSQAASGSRAAAHDVRTGGAAMTMTFSRSVDGVSMRINPTGGQLDEVFTVILTGFDARGRSVASETMNFNWRQDAFAWPTTAALAAEAQSFSRVTVEMRRVAQNNQPVRFLIDDLQLTYSAAVPEAPVVAALLQQRQPPRIQGAQIVQSPETEAVQKELRLYPAATRIRTAIDWDAVQETLDAQDALGLSIPLAGNVILDRAALPVLLPMQRDAGTLDLQSNRDSFHASFERSGRGYSLYGTRVLTVIDPAEGAAAPLQNLKVIETDYSLVASFSLYGASYTLTRYCRNDNADEDPACYDRAALGDVLKDLVVAVGATGRERP